MVWKRDGKSFAGTRIELDPSRDPRAIDVIPDGGKDRGERVLGIYKLEDDRLTICMAAPGKPRPDGVQGREGERLHPPHVHSREGPEEGAVTRRFRLPPAGSQAVPSR